MELEKDRIGYYEVLTEGDCEGRTRKSIGVFKGTPVEVAAFLDENERMLTYNAFIRYANFYDVTDYCSSDAFEVERNQIGMFNWRKTKSKSQKIKEALGKLSDDEIQLLGLDGIVLEDDE